MLTTPGLPAIDCFRESGEAVELCKNLLFPIKRRNHQLESAVFIRTDAILNPEYHIAVICGSNTL